MSLTSDDLAQASDALLGRELAAPLDTYRMRPTPILLARLRRLHWAAGRLAASSPDVLTHPEASRSLEEALTQAMILCLAGGERLETDRRFRHHKAIMTRLEDFLGMHPSRPLYLSEICAAAQASERTMRACCQEHPTAHGFQEYWGWLYHLDAMQGVSFPDINTTPTNQSIVPPCANTPVKGLPPVAGEVDPKSGVLCMTPPRPVIGCTSSDGTLANQVCKDEGPLTLERSKTVDEETSSHVIDFLDRNDPKKTNKPFFVWYNPAHVARLPPYVRP